MSGQNNVQNVRIKVTLDRHLVAQCLQAIEAQTVPAESVGGRDIIKKDRPKMISDVFRECLEEKFSRIKLSKKWLDWERIQFALAVKAREKADKKVEAGKYRKPKSEWRKSGRVPGKSYPNRDAAMENAKDGRKAKAVTKKAESSRKPVAKKSSGKPVATRRVKKTAKSVVKKAKGE